MGRLKLAVLTYDLPVSSCSKTYMGRLKQTDSVDEGDTIDPEFQDLHGAIETEQKRDISGLSASSKTYMGRLKLESVQHHVGIP